MYNFLEDDELPYLAPIASFTCNKLLLKVFLWSHVVLMRRQPTVS